MSVTDWAAEKLEEQRNFKIVGRTPENFLIVTLESNYTFFVAVLGVQNIIGLADVEPLFAGTNKPQLVVNVPSSTLWSGAAIDRIHSESASFGTLGDVNRVARIGDASAYRDKSMSFFINMLSQHSNVSEVSYVYENVFKANRRTGASLVVAVIEAYNMSAEDVRNARTRLGHFDVVVRSTSYGSITNQAEAAAKSIGAEALTYSQLMGRLAH